MSDANRKPGTERFTMTQPAVMLMPTVIAPQKFRENGKPKGDPMYSATFKFAPDSADFKSLKSLCAKVANEKWPGRLAKEAEDRKAGRQIANPLKWPWKNGDAKADELKARGKDREFYRGGIICSAKSQQDKPPVLSGFENGKLVDYDGEARALAGSKFYNGVEVLAILNVVAYESPQVHGVTFYLNRILTTGKGTKYSTGQSTAEAFGDYLGKMSAEDPTAGDPFQADSADNIPF